MLASASAPIAASRPLHSAIACTVPRWLWTRRRFGITSSTWFGSRTVNRGRIVAKYGAFRANSSEKTRPPIGSPLALFQRVRTWLMPDTLPAGNLIGSVAQAVAELEQLAGAVRAGDRDRQPAGRVHLPEEHPHQRLDLVRGVAVGVDHG